MPPAHFSKKKGLQNVILLGRVRSFISGFSEPAHYQQFSTYRSSVFLLKHTGSVSDINPGKGISSLGVLSRAFSVASASGSSSELYKFRSQCPSTESSTPGASLVPLTNSMAACSSFPGGFQPCPRHRNGQSLRNHQRYHIMAFDLSNRMLSVNCCSRITGNMKDRHQHGNNMLYRYFWSNAPESAWSLNPTVDPEIQSFHSSSSSSHAAGAAPDVSFDGSVREDQQEKNTSSHDQYAP